MGSSNKNGVDLGRINTCKIVGGKARHIEVRCREEVCTENCWECVDGSCVAQVGGQFNTEAECLANPFSNSCITDGDLYTGAGVFTVSFDYLSTNSPNTVYADSYWESSASGTPSNSPCYGPNGGLFVQLVRMVVTDASGNIVFNNFNGVTELVNWLQTNGAPAAAVGMTFIQLYNMWDAATSPGHGQSGGTIYSLELPCVCTGCGSGPGVSFECYEGAAGSFCDDPLDGSGQYATEAACLAAIAAGGIDDCDTNGAASGTGSPPLARTNGAPGTIFTDSGVAYEYYTDPANGISNVNAASLYFEVEQSPICLSYIGGPANTMCCEGPNSTAAVPTNKTFFRWMSYTNMWQTPPGTGNAGCCPTSNPYTGPSSMDPTIWPSFFDSPTWPGTSWYGIDAFGSMVWWTWEEILQDAIAAGITGVTLSTPYSISGVPNAPGTLLQLTNAWLGGGGSPDHPCMGQNYCIDSGATEIAGGLNGCEAAYDWFATNQPAADYFIYYWEDLSGGGATCVAPSGNGYYRLTTVMVYKGDGTLAGAPPHNTNAAAAWLNSYAGANISTATGSMTIAQLNALVFSSTGTLKGGNLVPMCTPCTCTGNSQIRCTTQSPWETAVCQISPCPAWDYCICEPGCDNITYDCDPLSCQCYDPGTGLGQYTGATALADCQLACCPIRNEESWDCVDGDCQDPGNGTGQFSTLALCQSSSGSNTCDGLTDNGLGPANMQNNNSYNLLVAAGNVNVPFANYYYESAMPVQNPNECVSPNGYKYVRPIGFDIYKNGVQQYSTGLTQPTVNDLVAWCNTNIGPGFLNTMTWLQMNQHSHTFAGWAFTQGDPANISLPNTFCYCSDCGSGSGVGEWECVPGQGCIIQTGGQYATQGQCEQAQVPVNPCVSLIDWTGVQVTYGTFNQIQAALTNQANGQTNVDVTTLCGYLGNTSGVSETCDVPWPPPGGQPCPELYSGGGIQVGFTAFIPSELGTGAQLTGLQVSYTKWDDLLTDCVGIPISGISASSNIFQVRNALSVHYSYKSKLDFDYTCCACTDGCPPIEPEGRKSCLVLLLDATDTSSVTFQTALPGPLVANSSIPIEQVMNLAYNPLGLGINPMAFYTWDKIDNDITTAPRLRIAGGMYPWNSFEFITNSAAPNGQYFIANNAVGAPEQAVLQPDTAAEAGYGKGWTIMFHRMTSSTEWINSKSWFMGDDVSKAAPDKMQRASGLKPEGQPYCRSNYYGHNHWDGGSAHDYEASPLNEMFNTGYRTLKGGMWYVHWIIATEQLPTGSGIFTVTWGVGNVAQFKDTMVNVNMNMVLKNINTRNRGKDGYTPGQGWISEVRAYDCAFNKYQLKDELDAMELKYGYGTLNIPNQLPPGCGDAFKSTAFDGVDGTYVEVQGGSQILPSDSGFTAAFWIKMNDCVDEDACLFEKGINLPADNEQVAFRLYLTDDAPQLGKLYWDVFGDNPVSYLGNYNRCTSDVAWLGEADCASLVGKWKHVAVTMADTRGADRKIYIDGVDHTGAGGGTIGGKVRRDTNFPFNIGDSSRADYTTKGNYAQFITWNTELSAEEIKEVYANGEFFDPISETVPELGSPYQRGKDVSFYTDFDTDQPLDLSKNMIPTVKHGGVSLDEVDTDPVDAGLPNDIPGLEIWLRAGTSLLADQDASGNTISRADYMVGTPLQLGDKIAIWQCHANLGRYAAQITPAYKPKYETDGTSDKLSKGIYTDATDRLQLYHTRAESGINIDATDEATKKGSFSLMFRIAIEPEDISAESVMGDTASNLIRINTSTQLRVKLGGGVNKNFTIPSAIASKKIYIFTLTRAVDGTLSAYIDGDAFNDQILPESGTHVEIAACSIDHILGIPGVGMQGWFFDFILWKDIVLSNDIRKGMYKAINETIRTL